MDGVQLQQQTFLQLVARFFICVWALRNQQQKRQQSPVLTFNLTKKRISCLRRLFRHIYWAYNI